MSFVGGTALFNFGKKIFQEYFTNSIYKEQSKSNKSQCNILFFQMKSANWDK